MKMVSMGFDTPLRTVILINGVDFRLANRLYDPIKVFVQVLQKSIFAAPVFGLGTLTLLYKKTNKHTYKIKLPRKQYSVFRKHTETANSQVIVTRRLLSCKE